MTVPFGQPPQYPGNKQPSQPSAQPAPAQQQPAGQSHPQATVPPAFVSSPNAERHLLEADALRRRQLGSAFLHGSGRTWRDRRTVWPFAALGIAVVAVVIAAFAVTGAFKAQQCETNKQALKQASPSATAIPTPCPGSSGARPSGSASPKPSTSQATGSPTPTPGPPTASSTGSQPGQPGSR
ncbi:hypothetical protein [Fodinicola acaciae]|uniref:hypothetical protein n=1 Tax=Fodinicola acaciae TaxID=2681555 RepID=UPI0013D8ACC3|nr:hypothetical protein [Fodinicola acaciae]